MGLFGKKNENLTLGQRLRKLFGGKILSQEDIDKIEEILIGADIGANISYQLIEKLKSKNIGDIEKAIDFLKNELSNFIIDKYPIIERGELNVVMVLGANGVGKTTSIAKLANYYLKREFKVLIAAADTFRAAATEQLTNWAKRLDIPIIKQGEGADPASVVFDAIDSAKARGVDLLLIDTAGRLHTKSNLMEELKKIERIIKSKGNFIKNNWLIIDGTTGQNAFLQAEAFHSAIGVDGIMMTKYDSQSKGGIIFTIQQKLKIPFFFLGTGEKIDAIEVFKKNEFIEKIFS
ncbi:MAG TPA: signal recognition particle-docking protein FtsY [Spirochaetota bacterium]|nr:signal recognition particle-docking protein FtsY [Spirochaetota bacterium]HOL57331.1 signal recognition particle-docking protein FtsY [Spirochaetota bacterium]HPP04884.1 signal recognition particle-docking protein FtsY [Spirochaetota bacterium]